MGWLGIPMSIMSMSGTATVIAIGVDDAIHHVHRVRIDLGKNADCRSVVRRGAVTQPNGLVWMIVSVRSGPVEMIAIGASHSSSIFCK